MVNLFHVTKNLALLFSSDEDMLRFIVTPAPLLFIVSVNIGNVTCGSQTILFPAHRTFKNILLAQRTVSGARMMPALFTALDSSSLNIPKRTVHENLDQSHSFFYWKWCLHIANYTQRGMRVHACACVCMCLFVHPCCWRLMKEGGETQPNGSFLCASR